MIDFFIKQHTIHNLQYPAYVINDAIIPKWKVLEGILGCSDQSESTTFNNPERDK